MGTNRYAYSDNDPVNKSDANGHSTDGSPGAGVGGPDGKSDSNTGLGSAAAAANNEAGLGFASQQTQRDDAAKVAGWGTALQGVIGAIGRAIGIGGKKAGKAAEKGKEVGKGAAKDTAKNAPDKAVKDLTPDDFGFKGKFREFKATVTVKDKIANVEFSMIQGKVTNPREALANFASNMKALGQKLGVDTVNVNFNAAANSIQKAAERLGAKTVSRADGSFAQSISISVK